LNIFPNPSEGKVFITRGKNVPVSIYDTFGRMILYTNDHEVNLNPGVYKVVCGDNTSTIIVR
ncbi:MAG: T9SS type A sorting domain-containing protein, partial [Flavobacteriales bacterium]